jgi:hypothetical protein
MVNPAPRDPNYVPTVLLDDSVSSTAIPATGIALSGIEAQAVAIVDASGNQITTFGGGQQYTDGGTPPTHPIAPTLNFDNGGTWQHVSSANPLPVTGGNGTVAVSGTVPISGTVTSTPGNSTGGTLDLLKNGTVAISGTVPISGTVTTTMGNITGGTINQVQNAGTIQNILGGTIAHVTNVDGGTIAISGTPNINIASSGLTALTTATGVRDANTLRVTVATNDLVPISGTVGVSGTVPISGTIASVTNLVGGTIGVLTSGSVVVTNGTVKLDGRASRNILSFGTTFGGTAAGYGTLVGSASVGSGTSLWVNDVSIVNNSGTLTAAVGFGTVLNGSNIIAKGNFGPQGGIEKHFPLAVNAGSTNADLTCYISAAGTVDFNVSYFISA